MLGVLFYFFDNTTQSTRKLVVNILSKHRGRLRMVHMMKHDGPGYTVHTQMLNLEACLRGNMSRGDKGFPRPNRFQKTRPRGLGASDCCGCISASPAAPNAAMSTVAVGGASWLLTSFCVG